MTIFELTSGFLEYASGEMVELFPLDDENSTEIMKANSGGGGPDLLKPLTKPLTNLIVQVDKKVLLGWSFKVSRFSKKYKSFASLAK